MIILACPFLHLHTCMAACVSCFLPATTFPSALLVVGSPAPPYPLCLPRPTPACPCPLALIRDYSVDNARLPSYWLRYTTRLHFCVLISAFQFLQQRFALHCGAGAGLNSCLRHAIAAAAICRSRIPARLRARITCRCRTTFIHVSVGCLCLPYLCVVPPAMRDAGRLLPLLVSYAVPARARTPLVTVRLPHRSWFFACRLHTCCRHRPPQHIPCNVTPTVKHIRLPAMPTGLDACAVLFL